MKHYTIVRPKYSASFKIGARCHLLTRPHLASNVYSSPRSEIAHTVHTPSLNETQEIKKSNQHSEHASLTSQSACVRGSSILGGWRDISSNIVPPSRRGRFLTVHVQPPTATILSSTSNVPGVSDHPPYRASYNPHGYSCSGFHPAPPIVDGAAVFFKRNSLFATESKSYLLTNSEGAQHELANVLVENGR